MRHRTPKIQEISMYNLLKPILIKDSAGHIEYINGHSDKSVYETFIQMYPSIGISIGHIARYRTEVFGKLKHYRHFEHTPNRIANLEKTVKALYGMGKQTPT